MIGTRYQPFELTMTALVLRETPLMSTVASAAMASGRLTSPVAAVGYGLSMVPEPGLVTVMMKCSVLVLDHCVCAFCRSCVAVGALEPPQAARASTAVHSRPAATESGTRARIRPVR